MIDQISELLSPKAAQIFNLDSSAYSKLVVDGQGNLQAKQMLQDLSAGDQSPDNIFAKGSNKNAPDGLSVLAGLWLWHDWLEESHRISQSLSSPTGSFWHAIMHRREGDFSNSKYWLTRTSGHPVYAQLSREVGTIINRLPADNRLLRIGGTGWNGNALVDLIESLHLDSHDPAHHAAVELQRLEWRILFRHSVNSTA